MTDEKFYRRRRQTTGPQATVATMQSRSGGMWWGLSIEAPDPGSLAAFYSAITDWPVVHQEPGTAILGNPNCATFVVFQEATDYVVPTWPPLADAQRPMMHLDFQVGDLEWAVEEALELGATLAAHQPNDTVRVMFDPAGHPFCLCRDD